MDNDFRPSRRPERPTADRYSGQPRPRFERPVITPPTPAPAPASSEGRVGYKSKPAAKYRVVGLCFAALLVLAGAGWLAVRSFHGTASTVPSAIRSQISFSIFYPPADSRLKAQPTSVQYDATEKRLSFSATTPTGAKIDFSEQATPDAFVDIPQAYDKLTASLQPYSRFDSQNGTVNLTHPKELGGGQSAVMNSKGTLLFARPSRAISDDDWRLVFNSLQIIH